MKQSEYQSIDNHTISALHQMNPWWRGNAMEQLPATRRHLVDQIKRRLKYQLAPITVVRGSRQIGKTTACLHVISDLLASGVATQRILRIQFDDIESLRIGKDPILKLVQWYENNILQNTLNNAAKKNEVCYLFFDEVQNLEDWSTQLKFLADHNSVHCVVTGSSALRIELGRDSLAGRINTIEVGTLSLTEIGKIRRLPTPEPYLPDNGFANLKRKEFWEGLKEYSSKHRDVINQIFSAFSERGAYPIAHLRAEAPWELVADQLNETVIKRVIQHDLRLGEKGRKRDPQLLEELFRLCCRYAGQSPAIGKLTQEIQTTLSANIGVQRVRAYLKFLSDTLLIRLIQPLEIRLKKKRSDPKICLADHGLRSSWLKEYVPLEFENDEANQDMATIAGYLAESIVGALFSSIGGLDLSHLPGKGQELEVDFVITLGDQRIPIEVKYRNSIKSEHYKGLQSFMDKQINRAPFGLLITKNETESIDERIITIPLKHFLILR
ncbi:MAG: AAA family ATPase [Flavobacteriales bacterium]|nr:AAA family ATPase [Flavobacteriales bacterium]